MVPSDQMLHGQTPGVDEIAVRKVLFTVATALPAASVPPTVAKVYVMPLARGAVGVNVATSRAALNDVVPGTRPPLDDSVSVIVPALIASLNVIAGFTVSGTLVAPAS